MIYQIYQNTVCVQGGLLYKDADPILTSSNYKALSQRYFKTLRPGGNGRTALIDFNTIPKRFRDAIIGKYGDPFKSSALKYITSNIEPDLKATEYFSKFKLPDGRNLPEATQREYFTNAQLLNMCSKLITDQKKRSRIFGKTKLTETWLKLSNTILELDTKLYPHTLPSNPRSLSRKHRKYISNGYAAMVHKNFGNGHAAKIEGDVADYLLATYSLPHKISIPVLHHTYNSICAHNSWPSLSESAIALWLDKPEVKRVWTLARHGREAFVNEFQHHVKRDRSNWFPNAYWAIDGTKLDWFHQDKESSINMSSKLKMNVIIDVFSEKIIGYSFSETENHLDHFIALKMAFKNTQSKPYHFTYDNQSGHKSKRMQEMYDKIVAKDGGSHYPHKAYAHNSPVEQVFNRFQQQCVNKWWFNDGQGVKAKNPNNRPNMDFIMDKREHLKTKEQLERAFKITVQQWNKSTHPHFDELTRAEVYNLEAPMSEPVNYLDQIDMFWISNPKQVTYKRGGLEMTVAKNQYEYEVYDADNKIDSNFRVKYTGAKFTVKYDPDDMAMIRLYKQRTDGKLEYVTNASTKRGHETIPALMAPGAKEVWYADHQVRAKEIEDVEAQLERLRNKTGITPESVINEQELLLNMGGKMPKEQRSEAETNNHLNLL